MLVNGHQQHKQMKTAMIGKFVKCDRRHSELWKNCGIIKYGIMNCWPDTNWRSGNEKNLCQNGSQKPLRPTAGYTEKFGSWSVGLYRTEPSSHPLVMSEWPEYCFFSVWSIDKHESSKWYLMRSSCPKEAHMSK